MSAPCTAVYGRLFLSKAVRSPSAMYSHTMCGTPVDEPSPPSVTVHPDSTSVFNIFSFYINPKETKKLAIFPVFAKELLWTDLPEIWHRKSSIPSIFVDQSWINEGPYFAILR